MTDLIESRNIVPCLRGHGYSSYNTPITSIKDLAEDMLLLTDELIDGEAPYWIVGHEIGAAVALEMAAKAKDIRWS